MRRPAPDATPMQKEASSSQIIRFATFGLDVVPRRELREQGTKIVPAVGVPIPFQLWILCTAAAVLANPLR